MNSTHNAFQIFAQKPDSPQKADGPTPASTTARTAAATRSTTTSLHSSPHRRSTNKNDERYDDKSRPRTGGKSDKRYLLVLLRRERITRTPLLNSPGIQRTAKPLPTRSLHSSIIGSLKSGS
ncbi:hypothetical protein Trydic_g23924 [Trypoxylus dichotomus]